MGSIHACFDESKGQKDQNLTEMYEDLLRRSNPLTWR